MQTYNNESTYKQTAKTYKKNKQHTKNTTELPFFDKNQINIQENIKQQKQFKQTCKTITTNI